MLRIKDMVNKAANKKMNCYWSQMIEARLFVLIIKEGWKLR